MVNYILIPSFINGTLKRNNLSINDILNFSKIGSLFSINDIVMLYALQGLSDILTNDEKVKFTYMSDIECEWSKTVVDEDRKYFDTIVNGVLVESGQAKKELDDRLFNKNNLDESNEKYELIDIGNKYYGIIIYPGVFPDSVLSKKLIKDVIKSMYRYKSHEEIARTQLYELYIKNL